MKTQLSLYSDSTGEEGEGGIQSVHLSRACLNEGPVRGRASGGKEGRSRWKQNGGINKISKEKGRQVHWLANCFLQLPACTPGRRMFSDTFCTLEASIMSTDFCLPVHWLKNSKLQRFALHNHGLCLCIPYTQLTPHTKKDRNKTFICKSLDSPGGWWLWMHYMLISVIWISGFASFMHLKSRTQPWFSKGLKVALMFMCLFDSVYFRKSSLSTQ